jgi:hypothetical protein
MRFPFALLLAPMALAALSCTDDAPAGCIGICEEPRGYDVLAYDVHASFDASTLRASVDIRLHRDDPSQKQLIFDSRVARIAAVTAAGGVALPFQADAAAGTLAIDAAPAGGAEPLTITIAYEAKLSTALHLSTGRDGDPLGTRTLYTTSEPTLGAFWLPANHRPSDRALFAIDFDVAEAEDVVSNGTRAADVPLGSGRKRVRYETRFTIPTYLMAFAMGDLVHEDDTPAGATPLHVWHRRGAFIDSARQLAVLRAMMRTFESLVGPYPFDTYSVVLLPEHPGGMENATITFLPETGAQTVIGASLCAHELGHQWFGDYVTVRTWEDVWFKEGMATLLAEEASRTYADAHGSGRLLGDGLAFSSDDAIRDRALAAKDPEAVYTSGPYTRAAWLYTQIRAIVGDDAFWGALRGLLAEHAFGSVSTDDVIAAFAPLVGEATTAKIRTAIDARGTPLLHVSAPEPRTLTWSLEDEGSTLLAPIEITVVDAAGIATTKPLVRGIPLTVTVPVGGYVAPDARDVHPDDALVDDVRAYATALDGLTRPPGDGAAFDALLAGSPATQEHAVRYAPLATTADTFGPRFAALDSDGARIAALDGACATLKSLAPEDPERAAWTSLLAPLLVTPASDGESLLRSAFDCGVELATHAFGAELIALETGDPNAAATRLSYLMQFDFGAQATFDAFAPLADTPSNAALRDEVVARLARQTNPASQLSPIPPEALPAWKGFFRAKMEQATSFRYLRQTYFGALGLSDEAALPILARKITSVVIPAAWQTRFVCGAHAIAGPDEDAWIAFQNAVTGKGQLGKDAVDVLTDPGKCTATR